MVADESARLLQLGIEAARAGRRDETRNQFALLLKQGPRNVEAWLWFSMVAASREGRRAALERVLQLDPNNKVAIKYFESMGTGVTLPARSGLGTLWLRGMGPHAQYTLVEVRNTIDKGVASQFDLIVRAQGQADRDDTTETYTNLTMEQESPRYAITIVNRDSRLIRAGDIGGPGSAADRRPRNGIYTLLWLIDNRSDPEEWSTEPFTLQDLGLSDEEIVAHGLGEPPPSTEDTPPTETEAPERPAAEEPSDEQWLTPISLQGLGLSDKEIADLELQELGETAPSTTGTPPTETEAPDRPAVAETSEESAMTPFSLEDLGLSEEEIAELGLGETAPSTEATSPTKTEAPSRPTVVQPSDEPAMTPFSFEDLGLSDDEIATPEPGRTAPTVEADDVLSMTPFSLKDLGLSDEEIAALELDDIPSSGEESNLPTAEDEGFDLEDLEPVSFDDLPAPGPPYRLFIVPGDNRALRAIGRRFLNDVNVQVFDSVDDALREARLSPPHAFVADIHSADISGSSLAEELRNVPTRFVLWDRRTGPHVQEGSSSYIYHYLSGHLATSEVVDTVYDALGYKQPPSLDEPDVALPEELDAEQPGEPQQADQLPASLQPFSLDTAPRQADELPASLQPFSLDTEPQLLDEANPVLEPTTSSQGAAVSAPNVGAAPAETSISAPGVSVAPAEPPAHPNPQRPASSPPAPRPTVDQQSVVTREYIQQTVVAYEPREQEAHTLDIHLMPRIVNVEGEARPEQTPGRERRYQVVLGTMEQSKGHPEARYFEGPLLTDPVNHARDRRGDKQYGTALHNALFHGETLEEQARAADGAANRQTLLGGYRGTMARAEHTDALRIQLRINNQAPELHHYKWEYLWDPEEGMPLACSPHTPFARVLHVGRAGGRRLRISRARPLRVLAALASPADLDAPDQERVSDDLRRLAPVGKGEIMAVAEGLHRLGDLVEPLEGANLLMSPDQHVSLELLRQRLLRAREQRRPFHVLHLLCHGLVRAEDGKSYLVLHADGSASAELVPEAEVADVLRQFAPELRLVLLASCLTALPTHEQALQGVARRLVEAGIPAVIAMQDLFEFEAAQHFAQRLYAQLIHHGTIDRAVNAARRELYDRRRRKRDQRPGRVSPQQWGIPVLFMSLPDGRLFDVSEQDQALVDPQAQTQALPYEQVPGGDPQRLAAGVLRTVAGQIGIQLNLDAPALAQALREVFEAARQAPAPTPADEEFHLFRRPGQKKQRWALVHAAGEHRRHPARRVVLFLRGLARARIAGLVEHDRLDNLTAHEFRQAIWSGGHVARGDDLTYDVLESGPRGRHLSFSDGTSIPLSSEWRMRYHGFALPPIVVTGNLTWDDTRHTPPPDDALPATADLELLLHSQRDPFAVFRRLTRDERRQAAGLDERTASLLLHCVYPDHYVPYHRELGAAVLGELELEDDPRYNSGFRGYCQLAADLLADHDLGFENLADVGYFFQRLGADARLRRDVDDDQIELRVKLQVVNLKHGEIDSELMTHPSILEQSAAALNAGKHIILIGPPGTGKTTLAEDLCRHAHDMDSNRGHVLVTATADWTTFDTIGGYVPESGDRLVFRPGIFLEAIESHKWLVIDEINRADIDKAFGELFTVLSGQAVTLPYKDNGRPVRVLPPGHPRSPKTRDYIIDRNWRIIGTMNVYDKASLFAMSYAFMRRFAFIDVGVPAPDLYRQLIRHFLHAGNLDGAQTDAHTMLYSLFDRSDSQNYLMRWRALGPAIAKDVVRYLRSRTGNGRRPFTKADLAEALLLYIVPQFDGLEPENVRHIYGQLRDRFQGDELSSVRQALLDRIAELFPFIRLDD